MTRYRLAPRLVATLLSAVLWTAVAAQDDRAAHIEVEHPWVRLPPPVSQTSAGYLLLRNTGERAERLVEVRTDAAARAEMHASAMTDGVMTMRRMQAVEVPAAGETRFEPGGLHIMLIGLTRKLEDGASVPMTLRFEHAGEMVVEFTVQRADSAAGHGH